MAADALCWLFAAAAVVYPQQPSASVRGIVVDARTNGPIADARVTLVEAGGKTVLTGPSGRFEFRDVAPRAYTLTVSTIGYAFVRRRIEVAAPPEPPINLTVGLAEGAGTYEDSVTVAADVASRPKAIGVSSQTELGSAVLSELRGVATDDPMRAIQALPGVATGDDFQAEFSVRGSAFRHIGVVLDGTPTQLLMHTVRSANDSGSVAMINADTLSRAALFGGAHARPVGDWLGATVEFDVREGSRERAGARLAVSGTAASAVFEGPLGRSRRGSWLLSLRKSYIDWLVRKLEPQVDSTIGFRDAQLKLTFDLSPRHQVQAFGVVGDAGFDEEQTGLANGIQNAESYSGLASVQWRYTTPRAVFSSRYSRLRNTFGTRGLVGQHLAYGVVDATIWRNDLTLPLGKFWTLDGGTRLEWIDASETQRNFQTAGTLAVRLRHEQAAIADPVTRGGWAQLSWRGSASGLVGGVRVADRTGARNAFAPWLLAERRFGKTQLRAGVGRSSQFADPIVASLTPGGFDTEYATAVDLGVERPFGRGLRLQVTGFFRDETNVLRRIGEVRLDPVTSRIVAATTFPAYEGSLSGSTRGVDVLISRQSTTGPGGWIGYTWSHTSYRDRSSGEVFDGDFDQRHTLNVFVQQRLSHRLAVSGKLRLGSNFPIAGYFAGAAGALSLGSGRNQVRLPFYSRLDVRVNRAFTYQRSRLTMFVEVMNVLGRDNGRQSSGSIDPVTLRANGFLERLIPRVPSAGLLFEF